MIRLALKLETLDVKNILVYLYTTVDLYIKPRNHATMVSYNHGTTVSLKTYNHCLVSHKTHVIGAMKLIW